QSDSQPLQALVDPAVMRPGRCDPWGCEDGRRAEGGERMAAHDLGLGKACPDDIESGGVPLEFLGFAEECGGGHMVSVEYPETLAPRCSKNLRIQLTVS